MATLATRLTSSGTLFINGSFDEVSLQGQNVPERLTLVNGVPVLQTSGSFDEVTQPSGVAKRVSGSTIQVRGLDEVTGIS
jgi:hypothetical protein